MTKTDFESILADSSRALADYAASLVGSDPVLFRQVYELAMIQKPKVSMRAARVLDLSCEKHPDLIRPYLARMARDLPHLRDSSVRRIFLHILMRHPWVEDDEAMGRLLDTLLGWLREGSQPVAVKAYSMNILENLVRLLPELKNEMTLVLEESIPHWESAALQGMGRRILRRLRGKSNPEPW